MIEWLQVEAYPMAARWLTLFVEWMCETRFKSGEFSGTQASKSPLDSFMVRFAGAISQISDFLTPN